MPDDRASGEQIFRNRVDGLLAALTAATHAQAQLREELSRERARKLDQGLRLGQILGRDYDGVPLDEVCYELVRLKAERQTLRQLIRYVVSDNGGVLIDLEVVNDVRERPVVITVADLLGVIGEE